jgi:hypothetical protein
LKLRTLPSVLVGLAFFLSASARAEDSVELAFMPETKTVILLNEGGK